ncbi:MAG: hypothetical protein ACFB14_21955 [Leptolyngbyaceae cyanobacterium]
MKVWSVCGLCLYLGLALLDWVTGQHWLADFSLPLSMFGGISLAIASNTSKTPAPQNLANNHGDSPQVAPEPSVPTNETPVNPHPANSQQNSPSISFTINKNVRP